MVLSHFYYDLNSSKLSFQPSGQISEISSNILGIPYDYLLQNVKTWMLSFELLILGISSMFKSSFFGKSVSLKCIQSMYYSYSVKGLKGPTLFISSMGNTFISYTVVKRLFPTKTLRSTHSASWLNIVSLLSIWVFKWKNYLFLSNAGTVSLNKSTAKVEV